MQVQDQIPRIFHHTIFEDQFLLHNIEDSRSKTSWQSEELVLYDSAVLFSILLLVPPFCPYQHGVNLQEDDAKFFEFSKSAGNGSPRASRPSKTCPDVPNELRVSS